MHFLEVLKSTFSGGEKVEPAELANSSEERVGERSSANELWVKHDMARCNKSMHTEDTSGSLCVYLFCFARKVRCWIWMSSAHFVNRPDGH